MKLIFIYGPPAVGKYTVGHELAKLTGYRLFHNHLTVLVARSIFPGHHEPNPPKLYSDLLKKMRLAGIEAAAEAKTDTIFTLAYSGEPDDKFVERIVYKVKKHDGQIYFVQLEAPDEVLLQRVGNTSRKEIAKMSDPTHLKVVLEKRSMHEAVKHHRSFRIDTSKLSAPEAAEKIVSHFRLG